MTRDVCAKCGRPRDTDDVLCTVCRGAEQIVADLADTTPPLIDVDDLDGVP